MSFSDYRSHTRNTSTTHSLARSGSYPPATLPPVLLAHYKSARLLRRRWHALRVWDSCYYRIRSNLYHLVHDSVIFLATPYSITSHRLRSASAFPVLRVGLLRTSVVAFLHSIAFLAGSIYHQVSFVPSLLYSFFGSFSPVCYTLSRTFLISFDPHAPSASTSGFTTRF